MLVRISADLDELVCRFSTRSLPKNEWTHIAHLAVGLWHVERCGGEEALARLRRGIRHLNESRGTVNSATSGYHETITRAYVELLSAFPVRLEGAPVADRLTSLLDGPLSDKAVLLTFYSRPRLMSAEARLRWVESDLAPLSLETVLAKTDREDYTIKAGADSGC